jgi:site-specific DNA-methyltransferase (adenine-specific)
VEVDYIKRGDCLELMKELPDESVDLIVTDPPYKMNHSTGGCTNIGFKNKWQGNIKAGNTVMNFDTDIKFGQWLPSVYRILKQNSHAYIFTNDKNMYELLCETQKVGFKLSNILVWRKNNATPNRYYMKNCEFVLFIYKGFAKPINDMGCKVVIDCDNISGKLKQHPTEKPTELLELYIRNSTKENDIVFDPFMGSGSTCVAAINTNRHYIGFELDEKYFEVAQKRIAEARARFAGRLWRC